VRDDDREGNAMAEEMTPEARRAFLTTGTRTAILATTRPDGRPHAVPVCFVLDNDDVLFLTNGSPSKVAPFNAIHA
jgi:nitroimidazol reductase NimA-like FMN-containing flavoprotein (pyridoxamine 5'-phosphate oxidase superfamily)